MIEEEKKQIEVERDEKRKLELAYISQYLTAELGFTDEDKELL